ncbi:MAG: hypothetical protein PHP53_20755 [Prolixibacteraceae bacterium]|nr:hypothetical protein [Prolixibacteraceae bacterium]
MEIKDKLDFLGGYMRVLTLLYGFKDKKSFVMTFDKIILYDFYLKYPETMFGESERIKNYDFEELYSFYHSEPDRDSYHKLLHFLVAKGLVIKEILLGSYVYKITELGTKIIGEIESPYNNLLLEYSSLISKNISKLSDIKVKEAIHVKAQDNIKYSN